MTKLITYGSVPVPYTVSWSDESEFFLGFCEYANRIAICQSEARGEGTPQFGKPHMQRQREAIARDLCDLCGKPLKNRTKVSLSHARPQPHAVRPWQVLQVEPLLHRECAAESMRHCPSLKRDVKDGSLMVRRVESHRVQFAIIDESGTEEATGVAVISVGHAKVELVRWSDRDADWLLRK